jgi:hypothetical protein
METMNGNTPSELLSMLVDGELDSTQETGLYAYLANSEELRAQMRELLAIKESVRNDVEAFTIPAGAKNNIFAAVGLTPAMTPEIPVTQSVISNPLIKSFWSKVWSPLLSATVAALLTAVFFLLFFKNGNVAEQSGIVKNTVPVISSNEINKSENTLINSKEYEQKQVSKKHSGTMSSKESPVLADLINSNLNDELQVTNNQPTDRKVLELASLMPEKNVINFNSGNYGVIDKIPLMVPPKNYGLMEHLQSNGLGITLLVRGISATSYPSVDVNSQANPMFNNMGIGAYIDLFDNIEAGLEVGQEPFGLQYYKGEGDITISEEQKNPIFFWAGFSVKAITGKHIEFLAGARPYAQLIIGGSKLGPLGRLSSGFQYSWNNSFGMMLGLEGTMLFYKNQGRLYNTEKLGMTYGLTYCF